MKYYFLLNIRKAHRVLVSTFLSLAPLFYGYVFITGHDIYGNNEIKVIKDLLILFLLFIYILKTIKGKKINTSFPNVLVFIMLVFGTFILIKNPASLSLKILRTMIEYNLMFFIVGDIFLERRNIINFLKTQLVVSLVVSIIGIFEYFLGSIPTAFSKSAGQIRIISTLFNPNALGWYLCITSLINISLLLKSNTEIFTKRLLYLMLILNLVSIFFSGSRSAIYVLVITTTLTYLLNKPGRLLLNSVIISILTFLIFSYSGIDLSTFRIIASGLETERVWILEKILNEISFMKTNEILFGSSEIRINKLDRLGLLFDSQIIIDFILGGLFYVSLKYLFLTFSILNFFLIRRSVDLNILIGAVLFAYLIFSVLGNITSIFPHAVLFWVFIKLSYTKNINESHKDIPSTAVSS